MTAQDVVNDLLDRMEELESLLAFPFEKEEIIQARKILQDLKRKALMVATTED